MEINDVYPQPIADSVVDLKYSYVDSLIGKHIPAETVKSIADSLEMVVEKEDEEGLTLRVPAYRVDVKRPCDVVEDILRIYGYNNVEIPTQLKSSLVIKGEEDLKHKLHNLVAEQLVGCGFNEIMNNSITKAAYYDGLEVYKPEHLVRIMNPLSSDLNVMRQTLLFGGLESIAHNANRRNADLRFFEFGNCYQFDPEKKNNEDPMRAYCEEYHLGMWVTGKRVSGSWAHPNEDSSFFELKAYVENVLARMGVPGAMLVAKNSANDIFAKAIALENRGGKLLVEMGIVGQRLLKVAGIEQPVYFADLNWTALMKIVRKNKVQFSEISKYPAVSRDLALLVDKNVEFAQIEQIARATEKKLLKSVELFDVYEGKNLPAGKKSYAVNFILQDDQRTLQDKQIEAIMSKLIQNLKAKLNAELR